MLKNSPLSGFRQDERAKRRRKKTLLILCGVALFVILARGPIFTSLAGFFHIVLRPFWSVSAFIENKKSEYGYFLRSKKALQDENARLTGTLDLVTAEAYSRELLRRENDELKAKLGRHPENELLLARVLATPAASAYDTLVIDAGERHGVFLGMKVFGDGEFVLGEVTRVFSRSAVVMLYSSYGNELPVILSGSSTPAVAQGLGGGNFRITLPKGTPVSVGDVVEIPALASLYAGVVEAVDRPEGSSLQQIYLRWPFNVYELKWVYLAYEE